MNKEVQFLHHVYLAADVYESCLHHAFNTEKEEVMGLLIGEVNEENYTSHISACVILHRSDKQPDRVEISPEQLCIAATHAEKLAQKLKRPMRVLGWYHSHPHITVWPSHVDVRTQAGYQIMDPLFIGLIFSVFPNDVGSLTNKVEVTCFQSTGPSDNLHRREVPLSIKSSALQPYNLETVTDLPHILTQEVLDHSSQINDKGDELIKLHNDSLNTLELLHIISKVTQPMLEDYLEGRLSATEIRIKELELKKSQLLHKYKIKP